MENRWLLRDVAKGGSSLGGAGEAARAGVKRLSGGEVTEAAKRTTQKQKEKKPAAH